MTDALDLDADLAVSDRVLFRELEDEAVLLDLDTGRYYGLDRVGTRIWELLGEHGRLREVFARMSQEYEVGPERLRDDLLELAADLLRNGLVARREPSAGPSRPPRDAGPVR